MQYLQPNSTLQGGKYIIEKVLGQGGFGITYLAKQSLLNIKVAVKEFFIRDLCMRDEMTNVNAITQTDMVERYRKKFFKEAQIIAKLSHPGIVRVIDIFVEHKTFYYVMEYVEGESLAEIVSRKGCLSESSALRYISKVVDALEYIHNSNVNHLDIKPSNIMIRSNDDQPVIIDFGVSKQYDEQKDQTTTTPPGVSNGYSPLEQYKPGGVSTFSPEADIYALGATLYNLLTGKTPPNASDVLDSGLPRMPENVSAQVCKAIEKAMQPRRADRPGSVREWMSMLVTAEKENTVVAQTTTTQSTILHNEKDITTINDKPVVKPKKNRWLWICVGVLALMAIGALLVTLVDKSEHRRIDTVAVGTEGNKVQNGASDEGELDKNPMSSSDDKTAEQEEQPEVSEASIDDEVYSILVDKIGQWDRGHSIGETQTLVPLYAQSVFFYGMTCSLETVISKNDEVLEKDVGFMQRSSNIRMSKISDNSIRCDFDKDTSDSEGREGHYPSYLYFENFDGDWLIVKESDLITDRNLSKRK